MGNHEWCFYGWREGAAHQWLGPTNAVDVWSAQITFEDIDAFCHTMQPEGTRLDYKCIAIGVGLSLSRTRTGGICTLQGTVLCCRRHVTRHDALSRAARTLRLLNAAPAADLRSPAPAGFG
jgi:hypothetical protein